MKIIEKVLNADQPTKWWFYLVLVPSLLPVVFTILAAINVEPLPRKVEAYLKLSDLVFAGMTLSISSLGIMLSQGSPDVKIDVVSKSVLLVAVQSCCLMRLSTAMTPATTTVIMFLVALSIKQSHKASCASYKNITL